MERMINKEPTNEELIEIAKKLKNKKAKEWRDKNKDKVKEIQKKYWFKKAKEYFENQKNAAN